MGDLIFRMMLQLVNSRRGGGRERWKFPVPIIPLMPMKTSQQMSTHTNPPPGEEGQLEAAEASPPISGTPPLTPFLGDPLLTSPLPEDLPPTEEKAVGEAADSQLVVEGGSLVVEGRSLVVDESAVTLGGNLGGSQVSSDGFPVVDASAAAVASGGNLGGRQVSSDGPPVVDASVAAVTLGGNLQGGTHASSGKRKGRRDALWRVVRTWTFR